MLYNKIMSGEMQSPDEQDAKMILEFGDEQVEANRENTMAYTFYGHLALFNHVFVVTERDEETQRARGRYIFKTTAGFEKIFRFCIENRFPAQINFPNVPECDVEAYENAVCKDIRELESFPDEWEKEQ